MFLSLIHALSPGPRRASLIPRRGGRRESRVGRGAGGGVWRPLHAGSFIKGDPGTQPMRLRQVTETPPEGRKAGDGAR